METDARCLRWFGLSLCRGGSIVDWVLEFDFWDIAEGYVL
jgi:hypothetical protein